MIGLFLMGHHDLDSISAQYLLCTPWEWMSLAFPWAQFHQRAKLPWVCIPFMFANVVSLFICDIPALVGSICGFSEQNNILNV